MRMLDISSECCSSTEWDRVETSYTAVSETPGQSEVSSLAPGGAPAVLQVPVLHTLLVLVTSNVSGVRCDVTRLTCQ